MLGPWPKTWEKALDDFALANGKVAEENIKDSLNDADSMIKISTLLGAGVLIFGIIIAVFLTRGITRPLIAATNHVGVMAQGGLFQ